MYILYIVYVYNYILYIVYIVYVYNYISYSYICNYHYNGNYIYIIYINIIVHCNSF